MQHTTFIGPDGETCGIYQHGSECDCSECETAHWMCIEREVMPQDEYAPNGSNYHDHLCSCPGCNYDGPDPTDEEIAQYEAAVGVEVDASHTDVAPFCDKPECACHHDDARFDRYIQDPYRAGLLTLWEAQALLWPER